MRILILGINYFPERTSVAPFTTGLSEHLAAEGHEVQVVTAFPYYPEWRVWPEYRGRLAQSETRAGVRIRRVKHFVPWRASSLGQRLLHDFSFTIAATMAGLAAGDIDIVYCSCPPPALALAAYVISRIRNVPYTIKLTDLASDAALATGILREGTLLRCARAVERFAYCRAKVVVCLCEAFRKRLTQDGMPFERIPVIPDWGDTQRIQPLVNDGAFRAAHNLQSDQFVVLHTGNMGKKQDLLNVVRAAQLTRGDPALQWLIVGDGEERPLVEAAIQRENLTNIQLLPLQPVESLPQMYAAADVLLLNQRAAIKDSVIPSKLLTYLAAGKPVLCAVDRGSEAARIVTEAACGHLVPPEDPASLAEGALLLRDNPSRCGPMGLRGRAYVEAHYSKAHVLGLYDEFFASILGMPSAAPAVAAD